MANFIYKRTETRLNACGVLDINKGTIEVDGVAKSIMSLLSDFNGEYIELNLRTKKEEEFDMSVPTED